ncbi:MAG: hypothetical protein ACPHN1_07540, partial [Candidatus Puniceispirillaceae bacterium]
GTGDDGVFWAPLHHRENAQPGKQLTAIIFKPIKITKCYGQLFRGDIGHSCHLSRSYAKF